MTTDSIPILALAVAIHMASFCLILFISKLTTDVVNTPKNNKVHPAPADTDTSEARIPLLYPPRVFNLKGFV
jgi:hypothetical protein